MWILNLFMKISPALKYQALEWSEYHGQFSLIMQLVDAECLYIIKDKKNKLMTNSEKLKLIYKPFPRTKYKKSLSGSLLIFIYCLPG